MYFSLFFRIRILTAHIIHRAPSPGHPVTHMAFEALKELQTLQELEQELDLELQQALELKQALELQYHAELEVDSGITYMYVPNPKHDEKLLQPGLQQQGKSAVATSSRLPIRNEAQSQITRKRGRDDCGNENGEQITSIQNEETDDTKRQKKDSSSSSSNNSSSSSSHKPTTTATVTRPQPSNQTSTETAGVSALDGTIEKE